MQNIGLYNTIQHNTYNNLTIYLNLSNYVWNYTISITLPPLEAKITPVICKTSFVLNRNCLLDKGGKIFIDPLINLPTKLRVCESPTH